MMKSREEREDDYVADKLTFISDIFFIFAAVFFLVALLFWFLFHIPRVIGYFSGKTARKEFERTRNAPKGENVSGFGRKGRAAKYVILDEVIIVHTDDEIRG